MEFTSSNGTYIFEEPLHKTNVSLNAYQQAILELLKKIEENTRKV